MDQLKGSLSLTSIATRHSKLAHDYAQPDTMFIHRADLFGLSQLYQLRGRIGRGHERGYAYITYETNKALTDSALKRLEILQTLDTLGSGFQLASYDMDEGGWKFAW